VEFGDEREFGIHRILSNPLNLNYSSQKNILVWWRAFNLGKITLAWWAFVGIS
jgi:hypothetical protein